MTCPGGFDTCLTSLTARETFRKNNTDVRQLFSTLIRSYSTLNFDGLTRTRRLDISRLHWITESKWKLLPHVVLV